MYSASQLLENLPSSEIGYDQCHHCLRVVGFQNPNCTYDGSGRVLVCESCRPNESDVISIINLPNGKFFDPASGKFYDEIPY